MKARNRIVKPEEVPVEVMTRINLYAEAGRKSIIDGVMTDAVCRIYAPGVEPIIILRFHNSQEKANVKKKLKRMITKMRASAAIIIADAQIRAILNTGVPTFLPPFSQEILVLEYRSASHHYSAMQMYVRGSDGSITFDDMIINEAGTELADGWFAGCRFAA